MSGGDLDGDVYFVCWDKDIMAHLNEQEAAPYSSLQCNTVDISGGSRDIRTLILKYMRHDILGKLCNFHLKLQDREIESGQLLKCAIVARMIQVQVDL